MTKPSNDVLLEIQALGDALDNARGEDGHPLRTMIYGATRTLCYALAEFRHELRELRELRTDTADGLNAIRDALDRLPAPPD